MQPRGWTSQTPHQVKKAKHRRPRVEWFYLYEMFRTGKPRDTKSWLLLVQGCRRGNGMWLLMGMLCGRWELHESVNILKAIKLYTLNGWIVWCVNSISINLLYFWNNKPGNQGGVMICAGHVAGTTRQWRIGLRISGVEHNQPDVLRVSGADPGPCPLETLY